jgi:hypothetical protein
MIIRKRCENAKIREQRAMGLINGLPDDIACDRDKLFVSKFWKALTKLTGVKLKMSTSYHPETDRSSERSNKTINQMLRYHVKRNQKGWARALP